MAMAGMINLMASVLQMNIYIGHGYSMSSTTSTEPLRQPLGPPPYAQDSMYALSLIRAHTSRFISNARSAFQNVVDRLGCDAAVLVADLRLGEQHHLNTTYRLSPTTNRTLRSFFGGDPGHMGGMPVVPPPSPIMGHHQHDPSNADGQAENTITFSPPAPGSLAAFWARFPRALEPPQPSPESFNATSGPESEATSNGESMDGEFNGESSLAGANPRSTIWFSHHIGQRINMTRSVSMRDVYKVHGGLSCRTDFWVKCCQISEDYEPSMLKLEAANKLSRLTFGPWTGGPS